MSRAKCLQQESYRISIATAVWLLATAALLFADSAVITAHAEEPALLRWNFAKGDRLQGQTTQEVTIVANLGENKKEQVARYNFDTSWSITQADQGLVEAQIRIDRLRFRLQRPGGAGDVLYDSDDMASAPSIGTTLSNVVGAKLRLRFRQDGRKVQCQIDDESEEKLRQIPNKGIFERPLSPQALAGMFESAIIPLPQIPVAPKASWKATRYVLLPNLRKPIDGTTTYTYTVQSDDGSKTIVSSIAIPKEQKAELGNIMGTISGLHVAGTAALEGPDKVILRSKVNTNYDLDFKSRGQMVKLKSSCVLTHRLARSTK